MFGINTETQFAITFYSRTVWIKLEQFKQFRFF